MSSFFTKLKKRIFGKSKDDQRIEKPEANLKKTDTVAPPPPVKAITTARTVKKQRDPYFIQVGFDFGTAFCKCVYRDIMLDKAWIHFPPQIENAELPFLMASSLHFDGKILQQLKRKNGTYKDGGLYYVKMALQKVGLREWQDPVLEPYRAAIPENSNESLERFVNLCAIYLIAGALGNVKRKVYKRYPGKVKDDYLAVNMAVPVADANHPGVNTIFDRVLRLSWILADELAGHPSISHTELASLLEKKSSEADKDEVREACFIYPEVSASVQGFVRSRVSNPGFYLFSDTGAGTVDQSVFLYNRPNGQNYLAYLHAEIFPLGSSQIERRAAMEDGDDSLKNLERWRQSKEAGENSRPLKVAKNWVQEQLEKGTRRTIAFAKKKLKVKRQIDELRIIFGGGGHCENPYRSAVIKQFDGDLFLPKEIRRRRCRGDSFDLGMPIPVDLSLDGGQRRWMDRLSVAYGLSFEKGDLATFKLPKDIETPTKEQIWMPMRRTPHAPTKDDV